MGFFNNSTVFGTENWTLDNLVLSKIKLLNEIILLKTI
ncbi:hypothetical protein LEP1GSC059_4498 [Leptospira noguchii serovar Panama str. CZ214]|uniref:Uncharacterized protein n=1 Tax=Leptospira noguchii serovar Panama str. CZ214 TaxID=1001595 RepID=T0GXR5_9LEPT|nr:hypothetical protein LEP1GSC059_4498 [Leptospira noguchii serovar Panama str. CZ214]